MRKLLLTLVVLVLGLGSTACCGLCQVTPPAATPQAAAPTSSGSVSSALRAVLERVRPQVLFRPSNESERELTNETASAGTGDRIRTPGDGKALLKWPHMYLMLFRGTEMETKDVTPGWIRLGLLAGVTVAGGKPPSGQHLALSTDYAEITLPGTTVMVAYHRETRFTIVRVFEGQVEVSSLSGAAARAAVGGGEWALVRPSEAPEVSADLTQMRELARDLGVWETFHEAELDVANGFGTPESRVPPSQVAIVFAENQRLAPAPPEPTRETVPIPVATMHLVVPEAIPTIGVGSIVGVLQGAVARPMLLTMDCGGFSDLSTLAALGQAVPWGSVRQDVQIGETEVYLQVKDSDPIDTRTYAFNPASARTMAAAGMFPTSMIIWLMQGDQALETVANRIATELARQDYQVDVKRMEEGATGICPDPDPSVLFLSWR